MTRRPGSTTTASSTCCCATRASLDGAGVDDLAGVLAVRDGALLDPGPDADGLASARRWFTSFGSCSILDPLDDLTSWDW